MSNDWFRSWHGAPTDNKWLLIAKRAGVKPIHVSGTWWALLDHASQHSDRGYVADFDIETFALFAGMDEEHVSRIVTTLCDKGMIVDGFIVQWDKRQPKREDATAAERQRRARQNKSKTGGKPSSRGGGGTPDDTDGVERHAMSHNVTPDKEEIREELPVANATGASSPLSAGDFCKAVFDSAIPLIVATGRTERDARSVIGRWRKTCGDADLLTLIRQSETEQHSDPLEWIMAAVETRNGNRTAVGLRQRDRDPALALRRAAEAAAAEQAGTPSGGEGDWRSWSAVPAIGYH